MGGAAGFEAMGFAVELACIRGVQEVWRGIGGVPFLCICGFTARQASAAKRESAARRTQLCRLRTDAIRFVLFARMTLRWLVHARSACRCECVLHDLPISGRVEIVSLYGYLPPRNSQPNGATA